MRQQDRRLHLRSLCIIVAIIESLVKWTSDLSSSENDSIENPEPKSPIALDANPLVVVKNPLDYVSMDQSSNFVGVQNSSIGSENVEQIASRKLAFRQAVKLFNEKPNKGISLFIKEGFIQQTPESIVKLLLNTPELNKSSIGDYIGDGSPLNIKVMHNFIDSMEFSNFDFVSALRHFLQAFRLPGEAQKIDRLMEKFADRYCECNPTTFAKADTAYTLAFSVIMLNTDQHSSQIKHRMDKNAFIKNNRGINDDADLPDEFLGAIFDEIHSNEIIMEDEHSGKLEKITMGWGAGESDERQRMEIYKKEAGMIQKKTQELMNTGATKRVIKPFQSATNKELARPLFSNSSWALMASLCLSFESALELDPKVSAKTKEPNVADLCLEGLLGAIRFTCLWKLETERDAYISSLAKLTGLTDFTTIKPKNIKAINGLVELAANLGDSIETAWGEIMKSLSQLERLQVFVLGDESSSNPKTSVDEKAIEQHPLKDHAVSKTLEKFVEEIQSQSSILLIDRIFTNTVNLSAHSIICFFKAVCEVSLEEVYISSNGLPLKNIHGPPRMYLLQKIVEIAYYNMHRIRFEWTQIWRILQPHFNRVACHQNVRVATFAIDALRQLGVKFLEREELGQFSTQHEFLKSFEFVIKQNQTPAIREIIVNSLSQMINARASRIRSGWKSIFVTLAKGAQSDNKTAQLGFQTLKLVFKDHFDDVIAAGGFVDLVACLGEFALLKDTGKEHDELVMSSIQMLQSCTKSLLERAEEEANGKKKPHANPIAAVNAPSSNSSAVLSAQPHSHTPRINNLPLQPYLLPNGCIAEEHFHLSWFPILSAFSRVIIESEGVLVRAHTMEILFETVKISANLFDAAYWKSIARNIIFPIFDDLEDIDESTMKESNSAVLIVGLRLLNQTITFHFELLNEKSTGEEKASLAFLLASVDRFITVMLNGDEKLASTGQICLNQFLISNVGKFTEDTWDWLTDRIYNAFKQTSPCELIKCHSPSSSDLPVPDNIRDAALNATSHMSTISLDDLDFQKTVIQCSKHLELVTTLRDFCLTQIPSGSTALSKIPLHHRSKLLECFYASYAIARLFNSFKTLRAAIFKRGWVQQVPNLVKQETTSLSAYITLMFAQLDVGDDSESTIDLLNKEILDLYMRLSQMIESKNQRDVSSWLPVSISLFQSVSNKNLWKQFGENKLDLKMVYQLAIKLLVIDSAELKSAIIGFLESIGDHFFKE